MITVKFYSLLRIEIGQDKIMIEKHDIPVIEALLLCEKKTGKMFVEKLIQEHLHPYHRPTILINGRNIQLMQGLETIVPGWCRRYGTSRSRRWIMQSRLSSITADKTTLWRRNTNLICRRK